MADDGIRIDELPPSGFTLADFVIAAMHDGSTYQLSLAQVLELVTGAAPGQLDTLAELAAAIANDDDFAATMTAALAGKADAASTAAAIGLKADTTALIAGLATKINTADIATLDQILAGTAGKVLTADVVSSRRGTSAWINLSPSSAVDFTGIPANVNRLKLKLKGVSVTGESDDLLIRLGTSASIVSTGYTSSSGAVTSNGSGQANFTDSFGIYARGSSRRVSGEFNFELDSSGYWFLSGLYDLKETLIGLCSGWVGISGTLAQVRLLASAGSFDAGQAKLEWEARL